MKLKIEIKMDNAAFEASAGWECSRILRGFIELIEDCGKLDPGLWQTLIDANGNKVGQARVTK